MRIRRPILFACTEGAVKFIATSVDLIAVDVLKNTNVVTK